VKNSENNRLLKEYNNRINRVFKFIDNNLKEDLSLNKTAAVAHFSPYHFHRVFKFITNETLNTYVTRRRIEKAASQLLHKDISVGDVAHEFGFSDVSSFSKTFKKHYRVSPTDFVKANPNKFSKIRQLKSKNGQEYPTSDQYLCIIENLKNWIKMNAKIKIKETPMMELAYVSCIGANNIEQAYGELIRWATPHSLMNDQPKMITMYHDSFKITEANKVRISASILLNKMVEPKGAVGLRTIDPGKYIVGSFELALNEFEKSWTGLFLWMNENGYERVDKEPFEIYHNNFNDHPQKMAIVDFYIPIK